MNNHRVRVRLAKSGKILLFLGIFLLFSAQNTGNNLLYLMSSCFFATLLWSGFVSWRNITGLKIEMLLPAFYFAGQPGTIRCRVTDTKGRPRFFLGFENDFVNFLPANGSVSLKTSLEAAKRGHYQLAGFNLFSFYPVDLFICTCEIEAKSFFVGPKPSRYIPEVFNREEGGAIDSLVSGKEGDYWMQKPYLDGEDAKLINWGISARSFTEWVLVKAVKQGQNKKMCFDFSGISGQVFEDCLEIVAGLIVKLRQHDIDAFVWAQVAEGDCRWLSVSLDLPLLASWLAQMQPGVLPVPPEGDVELLRFADLYRSNVE